MKSFILEVERKVADGWEYGRVNIRAASADEARGRVERQSNWTVTDVTQR